MSKLDKDQVIENFSKAYSAANGKQPDIEAAGGWYSVDGGKKVRLATLEEMTAELSSSAPAEVKTAKPAAKKTKAASKTSKSDFSVKAFWAEKILDHNPGSKLPR